MKSHGHIRSSLDWLVACGILNTVKKALPELKSESNWDKSVYQWGIARQVYRATGLQKMRSCGLTCETEVEDLFVYNTSKWSGRSSRKSIQKPAFSALDPILCSYFIGKAFINSDSSLIALRGTIFTRSFVCGLPKWYSWGPTHPIGYEVVQCL